MMTTSCANLPYGKAYELQTWCTDGGRRPASATGAATFKVKGQGRKAEPGGHTSCFRATEINGTTDDESSPTSATFSLFDVLQTFVYKTFIF